MPYDITAHPFTDLDGRDELAQAAGWAYDRGLIKGVGDSLFAPDRPLTREECATLLRRYDASLGLDVWLADGAAACNDYADISPWADDSLYWACIMGRMDWRNCRLAPLEFVTLAEAEALFPPLGENAMERGLAVISPAFPALPRCSACPPGPSRCRSGSPAGPR